MSQISLILKKTGNPDFPSLRHSEVHIFGHEDLSLVRKLCILISELLQRPMVANWIRPWEGCLFSLTLKNPLAITGAVSPASGASKIWRCR